MQIAEGQMIGSYVIDGLLGVGGMAEVWAATHALLQVQVAVKVLTRAAHADRMLREGRVQAALDHPNLLPVRDVIEIDDRVGLVLPLVRGPSLDVLLARHRLAEADALALFEGIVDGLHHAHRSGFVHRDLKPGNVLIEARWGRIVPRVADFGLVKTARDGARTESGAMMGTVAYAAPEQLRDASNVDQRADLFSLGVMLVELLTGHRPFAGTTSASLADAHREGPDLHGVPPRWVSLCETLLAIDPRDRPTSGQDVRDALSERPPHVDSLATTSPLGRAVADVAPTIPRTSRLTTLPESEVRAERSRTARLPAEIDRFVGRCSDLDALAERVGQGRVVSVLGAAGAGKTRLAVQYAREHADGFAGGIVFCDLSETRTKEGLAYALAQALGAKVDRRDPFAHVAALVAARGPCLVVLDNFEQLVEHAEATVTRFVSETEEARFLVTSRVLLGVPGETVLRLGPLDERDAVELFVERARARKQDFALDASTEAEVVGLVRELDGLPLAIELAAARIALMSPATLRSRLGERFRLLAGPKTTLRAAIDGSWELLDPCARDAFAQCSVFEGGFTLEAAEAVIDLSAHDDAPWTIDVLQTLVDASLVRPLGENALGERRFGMLLSMQAYARDKLAAADPARDRHLRYYAQFGGEAEVASLGTFGGSTRWFALATETDNVVAANRHAGVVGDVAAAVRTARAIQVVAMRTAVGSASPILNATLGMLGGHPRLRAQVIDMLAEVQAAQGQLGDAAENLAVALALFRQSGDRRGEAHALRTIGSLERLRGRLLPALEALEEALAISRELGEPALTAHVQGSLGIVLHVLGRYDDAIRTYRAALATHRERGNRAAEAKTLNNLAIDYRALGRHDEAFAAYEEALTIHREVGNQRLAAGVLNNLGLLYGMHGRTAEARASFESALAIHREVGDRLDEGTLLANLGFDHLLRGELDEAEPLLQRALAINRDVGNRRFEGIAIAHLARLLRARDQLAQAEARAREAVAIHRETDGQPDLLEALDTLGHLLLDEDRLEEAREVLEEALAIAVEIESRGLEGRVAGKLGLVEAKLGCPGGRERLERAEARIREITDPRGLGLVLTMRARLEVFEGRSAEHRRALDEARGIASAVGDPPTSWLGQAIARLEAPP